MHKKNCLGLLTLGVWRYQQISTSHYPSSGRWITCLEQTSSLTLTVRGAICCEIYKRRVIFREGNSDCQMGLIPDSFQPSLPEFSPQGKRNLFVKIVFFIHCIRSVTQLLFSILYYTLPYGSPSCPTMMVCPASLLLWWALRWLVCPIRDAQRRPHSGQR